jgi:hypothetical protein
MDAGTKLRVLIVEDEALIRFNLDQVELTLVEACHGRIH